MKRKMAVLIGSLLFLSGLVLILYPIGKDVVSDCINSRLIDTFQSKREAAEKNKNQETNKYSQLYSAMETYNLRIYSEHQKNLCDAWSYQKNTFDFASAGISDDMIGYISIEAMGIEIPLYIGANTENMSKGAVVLSQTSMPIGGINTNCVIAAHRGWKGIPMFRDIEVLKPGDEVVIANLWGSLHYKVVKTIVIDPNDIDAVKIMEGKDLITLITCHPYTKNYQRYVVYCSRSDGELVNPNDIPYEGESYTTSVPQIEKEQDWNRMTMIIVSIVILILIIIATIRKLRILK